MLRGQLIYLMPVKGSQPIYPRVGQPAQLRPFNLADQPGWRSDRHALTYSPPDPVWA